jgi:2-polyprenyl-3-methyl-5-hydroxy-6-metoxy-1,4-benzoquinol methylase
MNPNEKDPARLVARACPVCGRTTSTPLFQKQSLRVVRCGACSMVFADPIETGWADGTYYDQLSGPFYLSEAKLTSDYATPRFERELRLFRRFCTRGTVLDVGCSTGGFLYQLRTRFPQDYQTLGIDVAGPALDFASSKGTRVLRESYPDVALPDSSVTAITFWAVMEHLENPAAFLSKTARLLEPGGVCFVLVPNFESLAVRILGAKYRYIFPQHVNYFCRSTLRRFVAAEPTLRVIHETSMHFNPIVIGQDCRGRGGFVPDQQRAELLKRTTAYKQNRAMAPLKLLLRGVEALLGSLNLADNSVIVLRKVAGAA